MEEISRPTDSGEESQTESLDVVTGHHREKNIWTGSYAVYRQRRRNSNKWLNRALIRSVCAVVPKTEKVIDIGCGPGRYVRALRREGYDCIGIDGTPGISRFCKHVQSQDLTKDCREWYGA